MNYTQLIAQGIKNVRVSLGLTQEQFAEQIDMSVQGYRNIEQGKYLPTAKSIDKKISGYYEINNTKLYVTDGIGSQNVSMRVNNYPKINFYRLYSK